MSTVYTVGARTYVRLYLEVWFWGSLKVLILEIGELPSKYWNIYWILVAKNLVFLGQRRCINAFAYVLRAVLANSPNSVPPERVFSVLNDTFEDDMDRSHADYIELSLQLQFNNRSRE